MLLHANFIPQPQMFLKRWFKPKTHDEWFYHAPLTKPTVSNKKDHEIIKTLDEPLRDLFIFLSLNGFKTLPSCSGHFLTKNGYLKKYKLFSKDLQEIRKKGLILNDVENNKTYRYKNPDYQSPWNSFNQFHNQIENYASIGYIGIIKPLENLNIVSGPINIYTDRKYFNVPVMHIVVNNQKEIDIKSNWRKVLELTQSLLNSNK